MANEEFERIKVIGKGSYGEVWLSKHKKDKKQYVLKKMNLGKATRKERKSAEQEAKLLSKLKHPNIVSYKDSFETAEGFLFIAMQYCEGGDLYAKLKEQRGTPLEERLVVEWFVQIAMALQYMHERNILHRDLKTQNIFLTKSKIIKVGDLGIARVLDNASDMATTLIGTPYYMSPELFSNKPYNYKSDVWALGCCVYEMTTLKHAFNAKDMNSLVYKILKGKMPPMPDRYSAELLILMRSMMHQDPDKRPSVNRILRDPYIKKNIAIFLEDTKKNSSRRSNSSVSGSQVSLRPSSARGSDTNRSSASSASTPAAPPPPDRPQQVSKYSRDEPDSSRARQGNVVSGPPPRPGQARRPAANPPSRDLVPIQERRDREEPRKSSEAQEVASKEAPKSPKKESVPKKKNFLRNHAKSNTKGGEGLEASSGVRDSGNAPRPTTGQDKPQSRTAPSPTPQQQPRRPPRLSHDRNEVDGSRPLPVPRVEPSPGLPQRRSGSTSEDPRPRHGSSEESSKSSSMSSSKEDNGGSILDADTPRSLPNLSARERRRQQKIDTAASYDHPNSARIQLRRPGSDRVTKSERNLPPQSQRPPRPRQARQPSLNDSTSSSDESQKTLENDPVDPYQKEQKRENKEMNNFIALLDTTLHMNNGREDENSEDEEEEEEEIEELIPVEESPAPSPPKPEASPPPEDHSHMHKSISMPSVETLTNASRLMDRIRMLHKDCIQGVGYTSLKKAYEILDKIDEDEVEPKLVDLLGKDKFDGYAGKIWQLKFCEEALFMT